MSLKSCVTEDSNRRKLEVEVGAEEFAGAVNRAYHKAVGKLNVPGFRKGKAPRAIIEKMYGKEFFYEDAVNIIYPEALDAAIKEGELDFVDDKIDLDVIKLDADGLVFTAVITVKPEVTLGDYKKISVTKPSVTVSDEELADEIDKVRGRNSRTIDAGDRPAEQGDTAVFDFKGFVDELPFEGGEAEDYKLELGSGNFIPGFEEQMIGRKAGEEFDVTVTFPEEYHASELAGKPAVFQIKLHELKTRELPELDDEFAKDVSEFDTLEEYKADLRKKLAETAEEKAKEDVDGQLIGALVGMMEADIPEAMIDNRTEQNLKDFSYRLQSQGLSLKDYFQFTGSSEGDMRAQMREQAGQQVKLRLALEKIVKLEGVTISDEELDAEFEKLAKTYNLEIGAVKTAVPADGVRSDLEVEKAMELLRDFAEIKDSE